MNLLPQTHNMFEQFWQIFDLEMSHNSSAEHGEVKHPALL